MNYQKYIGFQCHTQRCWWDEIEVCIPLYAKQDLDNPFGANFWICSRVKVVNLRKDDPDAFPGFACDGWKLNECRVIALDSYLHNSEFEGMEMDCDAIMESNYWKTICEKADKIFMEEDWSDFIGEMQEV